MMLRFQWDSLRRGDHVLVHDAHRADLRLRPGVVALVDAAGSAATSRCATPTAAMPGGSSGPAASRSIRTRSAMPRIAGAARNPWPADRIPDATPSADEMRSTTMADKSPRQHQSKKSGKTLKEKRVAKKAKQAAK